ncbi:hypothetical protein [Nocardiopsis nanhaiensis]
MRIAKYLATGAAALAATAAFSAPALAQDTTDETAPEGTAETVTETETMSLAPDCVDRTWYSAGFAFVKNNCSTTQNVKVVMRYAGDSPCTELAPGESFEHRPWQPWSQYVATDSC